MENRIAKKVEIHLLEFKNNIKNWFDNNNSDICGQYSRSDFLKFIYDYSSISLLKDDFQKRKRIKNTIPIQIRCCAKRANGEQCTRRKKNDQEFCGTHCKGTPYGKINSSPSNQPVTTRKPRQRCLLLLIRLLDDQAPIHVARDVWCLRSIATCPQRFQ